MNFEHLTEKDLEQNEIDFRNFMEAEGAGRDILDEHDYFGDAFYEDDNYLFI